MKLLAVGIFVCIISTMPGCGGGNGVTEAPPELLDSNYLGTLELNFSNVFPEFNETTTVPVEVDKYGNITFGTGTLDYSGEDDNGETKINRTGTLTIQPNGVYVSTSGDEHFAVNENTTVDEQMTSWYWDGSTWQLFMDENIVVTWNAGLVFYLDEAAIDGSVCGVTTSQGSVIWTLYLSPTLDP